MSCTRRGPGSPTAPACGLSPSPARPPLPRGCTTFPVHKLSWFYLLFLLISCLFVSPGRFRAGLPGHGPGKDLFPPAPGPMGRASSVPSFPDFSPYSQPRTLTHTPSPLNQALQGGGGPDILAPFHSVPPRWLSWRSPADATLAMSPWKVGGAPRSGQWCRAPPSDGARRASLPNNTSPVAMGQPEALGAGSCRARPLPGF